MQKKCLSEVTRFNHWDSKATHSWPFASRARVKEIHIVYPNNRQITIKVQYHFCLSYSPCSFGKTMSLFANFLFFSFHNYLHGRGHNFKQISNNWSSILHTLSCAALASFFHKPSSSWCFCCSSSISYKKKGIRQNKKKQKNQTKQNLLRGIMNTWHFHKKKTVVYNNLHWHICAVKVALSMSTTFCYEEQLP